MARGAKVSGSRFYFLKGQVARLEQALMWMALDLATANGFTMMTTPTLVRPEIMNGTGFNVKHDDEIYRLERDDLYLVGTSEVALAGYHMDEILDLSDGPKKYWDGHPATAAKPVPQVKTPAVSFACTSSTKPKCSSTARWSRRKKYTSRCAPSKKKCCKNAALRIA
jgi:serine--tRNA ligase